MLFSLLELEFSSECSLGKDELFSRVLKIGFSARSALPEDDPLTLILSPNKVLFLASSPSAARLKVLARAYVDP